MLYQQFNFIEDDKNRVKKYIPLFIIVTIIIVSALRNCMGRDDDCNNKVTTEKKQIPIDRNLQHRIDSFIANTQHVGSLGLMVYDLTAKQDIYRYNEKAMMRPASCLKILSCVTAIRKLGITYKYRTRIYTEGKMKNDTLVGNIILKTQFDPAFNRDSLYILLNAVKNEGIKAVKGRIIMDVAFTKAMDHEQHWTIGDLKVSRLGLLYRGYGRLKSETLYGLSNVTGIRMSPDSIVIGRLNPHKAKKIAEVTTPLHYAIEKALKNSSNINAESLLYPLGYTLNRKGNYRANGTIVLRNFIKNDLKINPDKVCNIEDGCGLCPDNRVTPELLVALLKYARVHKYIYDEVYEDLPLSGTDGTLHDRLMKPNVVGKIKAKTGTLTREGGISSLSGFFTGADGHMIAFSIINNECPVMDGRWWQDKLCTKAFFEK